MTNFPWDLQISGDLSGAWVSQAWAPQAAPQRLPGAQLLPMQSSAEECSESEDYSEDQRFYQHILQMVKISHG